MPNQTAVACSDFTLEKFEKLNLCCSGKNFETSKSKNVTFCSPDKNKVKKFEVVYEVPKEELWFSAKELESVKMRSRAEAHVWRKKGYTKLLNDVFLIGTSKGMAPKFDAQILINVFCGFDEELNRRGLERHCSRKHAEQRLDAKDLARFGVVDAQKRLRQTELQKFDSADSISNSIAVIYAQASRDSKIYARRMGIGDENAVMGVISAETENDVLQYCRLRKAQRRLSNQSGSSQSADVSSRDSLSVSSSKEDRRSLLAAMKSLEKQWKQPEELYSALA